MANLNTLFKKLQQGVKKNQLVLNQTSVPINNLNAFFSQTIWQKKLVLSSVSLSKLKSSIVLKGATSFLNISDFAVIVKLWNVGNKLQVQVTGVPGDDWSLKQSFPDLPKVRNFDSQSTGIAPSFLHDLQFEGSQLLLTTFAGGRKNQRGLNLTALVHLAGPLHQVEQLLGAGSVALSGVLTSDVPELDRISLTVAEIGKNISFGPAKITDVQLKLESPFAFSFDNPPAVTISGTTKIGKSVVTLSSEVCVGGGDFIVASGEFENVTLSGLKDLAQWVGGNDLITNLPSTMKKLGKLKLKAFAVNMTPSKLAINYIVVVLESTESWDLFPNKFFIENLHLSWMVTAPFNKRQRQISCTITGTTEVCGTTVGIHGEAPDYKFFAQLAEGETIPLSKVANEYLPANVQVPKLTCDQLELSAEKGSYGIQAAFATGWSLPVGASGVALESVFLDLEHTKSGNTGTVYADTSIGGVDFPVQYTLPGDFSIEGTLGKVSLAQIINSFCGKLNIIPPSFPKWSLDNAHIKLLKSGNSYSASLSADIGSYGTLQLIIQKTKGWGFAAGLKLQPDWKLSSISRLLKPIDVFTFEDSSIYLSSIASPADFPLAQKGVLFHATCLPHTGPTSKLAKLLQLPKLTATLEFPTNLQSSKIDIACDGKISLGKAVTFDNLAFSVQAVPFSTSFYAEAAITVGKDVLDFIADVEIDEGDIQLDFSLGKPWKNPFGLSGVILQDTELSFGLGVPSHIGLGGKVVISKSVTVSVACDLTGGVEPDLLYGSYKGDVTFQDIASAFTQTKMPKAFASIAISDFTLGLVANPEGVHLGQQFYPFGFTFDGGLLFFGAKAQVVTSVSAKSISAKGSISPIHVLDGALSITGTKPGEDAQFSFSASAKALPQAVIDGEIALFGAKIATDVQVTSSGYSFSFEEKLFNIFDGKISAKAPLGSIMDTDFQLSVSLKQDFFSYVNVHVVQAIKKENEKAQSGLSDAKASVAKSQDKVNSISQQITSLKQDINKQNKAAQAKINSANNSVKSAEKKVDGLKSQINSKTEKAKKLAKKKYCHRIKAYWKPTPSWSHPFRGHWVHKTVCVPDPTAIAKSGELYTEVGGLKTALGVASGGLIAAQKILSAAVEAAKIYPVDKDPRVLALIAEMQTAQLALSAAQEALTLAKSSVGGIMKAASYIANGKLIDVQKASFSGKLSAVHGGDVALSTNLIFMGKKENYTIDFSFKSPLAFITPLVSKLLKLL